MKYNVNFDLELRKNTYPGLYIVVEGIDGAGKTTQVAELAKYYEKQGKEVLVTVEPDRTGEIGKLINEILKGRVKIPRIFNQYLFSADRGINQVNVVIPALKEGKVVISDRSFWSSLAYGILDKETDEHEKVGDPLLVAFSILSLYHQFITPDYAIYLDISAETAVKRFGHLKRDAEIYEKGELLGRLKKTYEWMTDKFKDEFLVVNGDRHIDEVTAEIVEKIGDKK